jgi:hypothetical protein
MRPRRDGSLPRLAHTIGVGVALASSLGGRAAQAQEELAQEERGKREASVDAAVFDSPLALGVSGPLARSDAGFAVHYRPEPTLRVGLRATFAKETTALFADEAKFDYRTDDFVAHLELHGRPSQVFDPWVGLGMGAMRSWRSSGVRLSGYGSPTEVEIPHRRCNPDNHCWYPLGALDVGADFRVHRHLTVGFLVTARFPGSPRGDYDPETPTFSFFPAPTFRLVGSL